MTEAWSESFAERLDDQYAPTPRVPGPVLRKRPIPDQLDYFSEKLAALLDVAKLNRETLITIGAAVVNLGAIVAQLREQPLPDITTGISDAEAEASATFDLTIDEVRSLKADRDAAVAECARVTKRAEFLDDSLDAMRQQAFEAVMARNAVEAQLAETSADGAQWQERAVKAEAAKRAAYADRSAAIERADEAERELAELRIRGAAPETVWGHQVHGDDGWIGNAVPHSSEAEARTLVDHMNTRTLSPEDHCRSKLVVHEVWHAETEWRVVEDGR